MKHIMLVEDEVELAQLVRDYLEAAGVIPPFLIESMSRKTKALIIV